MVLICTCPPFTGDQVTESERVDAYHQLDTFPHPEGYGTVERCRELARDIPSVFPHCCPESEEEEAPAYQRVLDNRMVAGDNLTIITEERINPKRVECVDVIVPTAENKKEVEVIADEELRKGAVGLITVAGGMSSRAGLMYPKGMYPIPLLSGKTFFQLYAEELYEAKRRYGEPIVWFIMTSGAYDNDKQIRSYFAENDYFGLGKENVIFIKQESVPVLESGTDHTVLKDKDTLLTAPNGHGGVYQAMRSPNTRTGGGKFGNIGALEEARRRDINTFLYIQVDNPLPAVNRAVLGNHIKEGADFTTILAQKTKLDEEMGMVAKDKKSGTVFVVEYNQPAAKEIARAVTGNTAFGHGLPARFVFSRDFLVNADKPPYHMARGKEARVFKDGVIQEGRIDKFESFVFDTLPQAKRPIFIELPRGECFQPFKKFTGEYTPEAAAEALSNLYKKWLKESGVAKEISEESIVELSYAFATCIEDIQAKIGQGLRIEGSSKVYLGGRDINIGKNVTVDGIVYIAFQDPYDGSITIEDGSQSHLVEHLIQKGESSTLDRQVDGAGRFPGGVKEVEKFLGVGAAKGAWEYIKKNIETYDKQVARKRKAFLARLYHAMERTFRYIIIKIQEGKIRPFQKLNLMRSSPEEVDYHLSEPDDEMKVGFFPIAGNPLTWGHILPPLMCMNRLELDTIVLRVQGEIKYKKLWECERVPAKIRHFMVRKAIEKFYPLIRYCDLGLEKGNFIEGSEEMHRFLKMNANRKMHVFYLIGAENEERVRHYIEQQYEMFKRYNFGENPNHKVTLAVIQRGEYGETVTLEELESISKEVQDKCGAEQSLDVTLIKDPDIDLRIASSYYRNVPWDGAIVPKIVHELSREHGYYGHPPINPKTKKPVAKSPEKWFRMRLGEVARKIAANIGRAVKSGVPGNTPLISIDGGSGSGKTTVAGEAAKLSQKFMSDSLIIPLDMFMRDRAWRLAIQKRVTGNRLSHKEEALIGELAEKIKPREPYLGEEDFFDHAGILNMIQEIDRFRRSEQNAVANLRYIPLLLLDLFIFRQWRVRTDVKYIFGLLIDLFRR
ncbi:MAG: UTP--glucose-1-phosphate uridylyltransferase, partial [Deltaproteobacteria bacterium]|nr:UTP--glucose-1-phosphate uridylyltransferase [Deltaproteobacteria bacterium]